MHLFPSKSEQSSSILARSVAKRAQPLVIWAVIFLVTSVLTHAVHEPRIRYDGIFYFVQLRSLYFDGDIDFHNDAKRFPWIGRSFGTVLPNQKIANPFPIGSAVLWSPFFVVADISCRLYAAYGCDGYSLPYVRSIITATVFWTTLGFVLSLYTIKRLAGQLRQAMMATAFLAMASPLIFYTILQAEYSHGNSYFAISLLLYSTLWTQERKSVLLRHFLCGLALGLVFLVRWQDLAIGLLPLAFIFFSNGITASVEPQGLAGLQMKKGREMCGTPPYPRLFLRTKLVQTGAVMCGCLLAASPQLLFWRALYGTALTIPQGTGFLSFANMMPVEFFFSTWNGMFLWHPILLFALLGFVVRPRTFFSGWSGDAQLLRRICILIIAVEIVICMLVADWWSGGALGQRRLVSTLPLLGLGFYHLTDVILKAKSKLGSVVFTSLMTLFVLWNGLTMLRFYQGKLPFNPPDPVSYESGEIYEHYDYGRRFRDIISGDRP